MWIEGTLINKKTKGRICDGRIEKKKFFTGVTRMDKIRNEFIRGTAHVGKIGDKVREARLRWYGHVQRREEEYVGRRVLGMDLPGRRRRGRPKRRFMDAIREDMRVVGALEDDVRDRERWRRVIRCGDP